MSKQFGFRSDDIRHSGRGTEIRLTIADEQNARIDCSVALEVGDHGAFASAGSGAAVSILMRREHAMRAVAAREKRVGVDWDVTQSVAVENARDYPVQPVANDDQFDALVFAQIGEASEVRVDGDGICERLDLREVRAQERNLTAETFSRSYVPVLPILLDA
ncbi:hypothetical protein [Hyphomicrobium sp. NDB2Meth4]|uniref:hypothetical protein n=1 Tax=Hyphomicrobium sp. NDB2Meth4 TaxID=1892846 RepID=UPI001FCDAF26|nr:hypothetical protein [Hyphomicrobium sp. NDB2Meth4]